MQSSRSSGIVYLAGNWPIAVYPSFHVATAGDFRFALAEITKVVPR